MGEGGSPDDGSFTYGKFTSNYKASPIDFETQRPSVYKPPRKTKPLKKAFEKYKPRGLFSEFYGIWHGEVVPHFKDGYHEIPNDNRTISLLPVLS